MAPEVLNCPHLVTFKVTQTRTLSSDSFDQFDGSMVPPRDLDIPGAIALALVMFLESPVWFVVLGCIVVEPKSPFLNVNRSKLME
jgi:hypothetical protein